MVKHIVPSNSKLEPIGSIITSSSISSSSLKREENIKEFKDEDYVYDETEGLSPFYGVLDNVNVNVDIGDMVYIHKN
jgi:hypothetical protein